MLPGNRVELYGGFEDGLFSADDLPESGDLRDAGDLLRRSLDSAESAESESSGIRHDYSGVHADDFFSCGDRRNHIFAAQDVSEIPEKEETVCQILITAEGGQALSGGKWCSE